MAERRLKFLKKRLDKDPKLLTNYNNYIEDLVMKGYARKVPEKQLNPDNSDVNVAQRLVSTPPPSVPPTEARQDKSRI
jgi:hypothetical protein